MKIGEKRNSVEKITSELFCFSLLKLLLIIHVKTKFINVFLKRH